jgi:hypothetical protein
LRTLSCSTVQRLRPNPEEAAAVTIPKPPILRAVATELRVMATELRVMATELRVVT